MKISALPTHMRVIPGRPAVAPNEEERNMARVTGDEGGRGSWAIIGPSLLSQLLDVVPRLIEQVQIEFDRSLLQWRDSQRTAAVNGSRPSEILPPPESIVLTHVEDFKACMASAAPSIISFMPDMTGGDRPLNLVQMILNFVNQHEWAVGVCATLLPPQTASSPPIDDGTRRRNHDDSWANMRDIMLSSTICVLLALGEGLQQRHYQASLKWLQGPIAAPAPPALVCSPFLRGLKECGRDAVGVIQAYQAHVNSEGSAFPWEM